LLRYGDRCLEELKLESANVSDDPSTLLRSIGILAQQTRMEEDRTSKPVALPYMPWHKKWIFSFVLQHARRLVRNRENLRFERTRLFGRVRRLIKGLGHVLYADGLIDDESDVFYLEMSELLGVWEGTGTTSDVRGIVHSRKREFLRFHDMAEPPDRIVCHGPLHRYQEFPTMNHGMSDGLGNDNVIQGIGACAGIVRGKVRVVFDPRNVVMNAGEIIVARQTDPGWVVLFPAAAGLLVERGSLLSHSAIVSRELRLPCVVSIRGITQRLKDGDEIEMDGGTGKVKILS
jgi:pyruvate,water dikinase